MALLPPWLRRGTISGWSWLGQRVCSVEPLARGRGESKNTGHAIGAMHKSGQKIPAEIDGGPSKHLKFLL